MPSYDYDSGGYGRTLADLMRRRGDQAAARHLQQGDIAANLWGQAGQTIANSVAGWQRNVQANREYELESARESRRAEAEGIQIEAAKGELKRSQRKEKGEELTRSLLPLARRQDGLATYDRNLIAQEFEAAGMSDQLPTVLQKLDEQDSAHMKVLQARRDAVGLDAFRVLQSGGDEATYAGLLQYWEENDALPVRELDALKKLGKNPETRQQALMAAVQSSPTALKQLQTLQTMNAPKMHNVPEGGTVIDERTGEVLHQGQPKLSLQPKEVLVNGRPAMAAFNPQTGQWQDQAGQPISGVQPIPPREPQGPAPSFTTKEVLNDAGERVVANYDNRTGKMVGPDGQPIQNPRPIPSAMETQDTRKFKQAGPILGAVSELSEKINTAQGLIAKMSGGARKVASQANYDDDVAEYEALISGFTPLVARALGHAGVLTQQDVDSVKALFPKPGDSKTLRDRKITRINSIIGELESGARPPQTTPKGEDGWTDVGGFKVRVKP